MHPIASKLRSSKMTPTQFRALCISFFLLFHMINSEEIEVIRSLIQFLGKISNNNGQPVPGLGWNLSSDPCKDKWKGITCDSKSISVRNITLDGLSLSGILDATSLCSVSSLTTLSLFNNKIGGVIPAEISNCKRLTRLRLSGNQFSDSLPDSISMLKNLKRLEISNNKFSGKLPDIPRISGLNVFLAQNNQFIGKIPQFDFSNLDLFNVSMNNFSGQIPDVQGKFTETSFLGNPELCGKPLFNNCTEAEESKSDGISNHQIILYSGYVILGLVFVSFILYKFYRVGKKNKEEIIEPTKKMIASDESSSKPSGATGEYKTGESISEFSVASAEQSALLSSSLVVLTSPVVNGLRFDDLLKAPAELLGRGKHGSVYKVIFEDGMTLVVKRIKEWTISSDEFKRRMQKIDEVKHPNVLPAMAYYCSKQEKLLVYQYQQNGSLHTLLHGTQIGNLFDWGARLGVASSIAEALAFMHQELREDGISHGNLKSSNILFKENREPCISEYGLMVVNNQHPSTLANVNPRKAKEERFKLDIYGLGVILLELLTGKSVQQSGFDLTKWVHSVVREEWTAEVFDKKLISEGASEERMVNLLQIAIKCVNHSPEVRPSISQVAVMINSIKEEEDRSIVSASIVT